MTPMKSVQQLIIIPERKPSADCSNIGTSTNSGRSKAFSLFCIPGFHRGFTETGPNDKPYYDIERYIIFRADRNQ